MHKNRLAQRFECSPPQYLMTQNSAALPSPPSGSLSPCTQVNKTKRKTKKLLSTSASTFLSTRGHWMRAGTATALEHLRRCRDKHLSILLYVTAAPKSAHCVVITITHNCIVYILAAIQLRTFQSSIIQSSFVCSQQNSPSRASLDATR